MCVLFFCVVCFDGGESNIYYWKFLVLVKLNVSLYAIDIVYDWPFSEKYFIFEEFVKTLKLFSVNVKTEKQESWFLRELLTPECKLVLFLKFKF